MPSNLESFGLRFNPFSLKEGSLETKFQTYDLKQAHIRMKRTAAEGGICLLTGVPGKGVSFAANSGISEIEKTGATVRYMTVSHTSVRDFYKGLCRKIDTVPSGKTCGALLNSICAAAGQLKEQRRPLYLILDNAQNIPKDALMDLSQMILRDNPPELLMSVSLCGTEKVKADLRADASLKPLVCDFYTMNGLSSEEIGGYVRHKLRLAGGNETAITDDAVHVLHSYSAEGNYRIVNNLMRDAVYIAALKELKQIDSEVIRSSATHQF